MYILLTEDMRLMVTKNEAIYRGENMSKEIVFLLPLKAGTTDVGTATVFLTYVRPDGNPDIVILERKAEMYDASHYKYVMPVTCKLSRYAGSVCMWLQLYSGDYVVPTVAKSGECTIRILDDKNLDNCMSDHQLTALYQLKKKVDNMVDNDCPPNDSTGGSSGGSSDEGFEAVEF